MSSVNAIKSSRASGSRRTATKHGGKSLSAPTLGVHTSDLGDHRLNISQIYSLDAMYHNHPAVQAARTVLHSQLLSGGVRLMRDGEPAKVVKFGERSADGSSKKGITIDFQRHLDEHWLPFARDIIDCFLKWGLCAVVFDVLPEDTQRLAMSQLKRELGVSPGDKRKEPESAKVIVPHVPQLGTYDVAYSTDGRYGYTRQYFLYNNSPGHATRVDETAMVHIRQHPDSVGNVNSPPCTRLARLCTG